MKRQAVLRSCGTHDGSFHADEVTACALLITFNVVDRHQVIRSRDMVKLQQCEYICDVGGFYDPQEKWFDHHQVNYLGEHSSAGLVLEYLREAQKITMHEYELLRGTLVMGVDAHDNGRAPQQFGYCTFSHVISNFVPIDYDSSDAEMNEAFFRALDFAIGHLQRAIERFHYNLSCRNTVEEAMKRYSDCLIFDSFFALDGENHPALFIIMPSGSHWKLRGIPPCSEDRMNIRMPLPMQWAGLLDEQLKRISGIPGAIFCHKGRFISVWETQEDALKALKYTLEHAKEKKNA
jgi:uncharacterized UPF0160 family protein